MKIKCGALLFLICAPLFAQEPLKPQYELWFSAGYAHNFLSESMTTQDFKKRFSLPPGTQTVESDWQIPSNGFYISESFFVSKFNAGFFSM